MNAWLDAWQARQVAQGALRPNGSAPAAQQRQQRQQQQDEPMQAVSPTVSMSAAAGLSRAPAPGRRKPQARSGSAHQPQGGGRLLAASASPFPPKARERYSNAYDSDLTPLEVARSAQQVRAFPDFWNVVWQGQREHRALQPFTPNASARCIVLSTAWARGRSLLQPVHMAPTVTLLCRSSCVTTCACGTCGCTSETCS